MGTCVMPRQMLGHGAVSPTQCALATLAALATPTTLATLNTNIMLLEVPHHDVQHK